MVSEHFGTLEDVMLGYLAQTVSDTFFWILFCWMV